jgi:hypothetical protein
MGCGLKSQDIIAQHSSSTIMSTMALGFPSTSLSKGLQGSYLWNKDNQRVKLTIHFQLVLRFRMHGT